MKTTDELKNRIKTMIPLLDERQRRIFLATFGTASLDLAEKLGRTLVRFDRFFQELVHRTEGPH